MSPDVSYGFDCEVQMYGFTADVSSYFYNFANFNVDQWYDGLYRDHRQDFESRSDVFCTEAKRLYNIWFEANTSLARGYCVLHGFETYPWIYDDILKTAMNKKIETLNNQGLSDEQIIAQLSDDREILDSITTDKHIINFISGFRELVRKAQFLGRNHLIEAADFKPRLPEETIAPWSVPQSRPDNLDLVAVEIVNKRVEKKKRKAIVKSVEMLGNLTGRETVNLFLGGEEIVCRGQKYNFTVKKKNLFGSSFHALDVCVSDKEENKLVDLCWYIDKTPAAEQIVGLMLHVAHGQEDEIIKTGNVIKSHNSDLPSYKELYRHKFNLEPMEHECLRFPQFNTVLNRIQPVLKPIYKRRMAELINIPLLGKLLTNEDRVINLLTTDLDI